MSSKMTPAERRQAEKQALQETILDAARKLFARYGYEATTMRAIAEAISYAPAAVYYHFRDKTDLVRELSNRDFGALMQHFSEFARVPDPMLRLFLLGQAYLEFALRHPEQYRFMFMTRKPKDWDPQPGDIERGNPQQDAYAFLVQTAAQCIAEGRIREGLTDPHELSQIAWSSMYGVAGIHLSMTTDPNIPMTPVRRLGLQVGLSTIQGVAAKPKRETERALATFQGLFTGERDLEQCRHELHQAEAGAMQQTSLTPAAITESTTPVPSPAPPRKVRRR